MDGLAKFLVQLGTYGPLGVFCAVFIFLYWQERKRNMDLSDKLFEVSINSVKADMEHTRQQDSANKTLDVALKALGEKRHDR